MTGEEQRIHEVAPLPGQDNCPARQERSYKKGWIQAEKKRPVPDKGQSSRTGRGGKTDAAETF
jgi:hypothetical protein